MLPIMILQQLSYYAWKRQARDCERGYVSNWDGVIQLRQSAGWNDAREGEVSPSRSIQDDRSESHFQL